MRKDPEVRVNSAPGRAKGTSDSPFLLIHLPELGTRHGTHIRDYYQDLSGCILD